MTIFDIRATRKMENSGNIELKCWISRERTSLVAEYCLIFVII